MLATYSTEVQLIPADVAQVPVRPLARPLGTFASHRTKT